MIYNFNDDESLFRLGIRSGDNIYVYEVHKNIPDAESDGMRVTAYETRKRWGEFSKGQ